MTGWDNRDRLFHRIDVGKGTGKFKDTRQTRFQNLFTEVIQFQFRVRAPRTVAAAAFADFDHDGTRHHVTARQVFSVRGITLHKAFAVFVQQVTAFAAATFGNQNPSPGDTGRVNCHISISCTGTPARMAIPTPSPVLMWALVVD